jgi:ankyrin repeat protein
LAYCQLQLLQHTLAQDLPRALPELPETLDQAYEQILKSIDSANRDHAYRLLQCLTVAIRPLRVEELMQVLAVDSGTAGRAGITRVKSGWRTADQRQVMSVLSECSSLIWIDSQVVQLSHFSVKEFLTSERLANSRRGVSRYHVSLRSAHTTVAQACLSVLLSLDDCSNLGDFPLAQYAANHWDDHVRFKGVSSDSRIWDMIQCFLDGNKSHWRAWHRLRDDDKFLPPSADDCPVSLFYAAFYGLYEVVERLILKHPQYINPRVHSRATPLHAALMGNRFDVAQLLYNHGAKATILDGTKSTLLHVAFQASDRVVPSVKVLEWLLGHGAGVHVRTRDENERTPLHLAAENGRVEAVWMLIEHKAEIEAQDKHGRTPLHVAVGRQSLQLVQTLIEHKANVNSRDKKGKTPLHLAVQWRHFDIARMLIEYRANVNLRDKDGKTPLHVAAIWEHPDIARMLIDHKAHVNERDEEGMTPLHVAVHYGRHHIARTLIKHQANVNAQNNNGHTPLHVARHRGQHDIAQMLREYTTHMKLPSSSGGVGSPVGLYGKKIAVNSITNKC